MLVFYAVNDLCLVAPPTTTPAVPPDTTPYGLIIGVSIGGAVVLAGVVILIVYLARRAAVAQPTIRLDAPVRFLCVQKRLC